MSRDIQTGVEGFDDFWWHLKVSERVLKVLAGCEGM